MTKEQRVAAAPPWMRPALLAAYEVGNRVTVIAGAKECASCGSTTNFRIAGVAVWILGPADREKYERDAVVYSTCEACVATFARGGKPARRLARAAEGRMGDVLLDRLRSIRGEGAS